MPTISFIDSRYHTSFKPPNVANQVKQFINKNEAKLSTAATLEFYEWDGSDKETDEILDIAWLTPNLTLNRCTNTNEILSSASRNKRRVTMYFCRFNDSRFHGTASNLTCNFVYKEPNPNDWRFFKLPANYRTVALYNAMHFFVPDTTLSVQLSMLDLPSDVLVELKRRHFAKVVFEIQDFDVATIFEIDADEISIDRIYSSRCGTPQTFRLAPLVIVNVLDDIFDVSLYETILSFLNLLQSVRNKTSVKIVWKNMYPSAAWLKRVHRAIVKIPGNVTLKFVELVDLTNALFKQYEQDRQKVLGFIALLRADDSVKTPYERFSRADGDQAVRVRTFSMDPIQDLNYDDLMPAIRNYFSRPNFQSPPPQAPGNQIERRPPVLPVVRDRP